MSRVLVTGAGGFIGSHLVERLAEGGSLVRAFIRYNSAGSWGWLEHMDESLRDRVEVIAGDIRDAQTVRQAVAGCETVFHLAALIGIPYSYSAPDSYVATNVTGTLNVVQAARDTGVARVVHTSTSEVYGTAQEVPINEDHPLNPQSPYAATKVGADQIALSYHRSFGTPVVVLRPFNTYGPRQSARAVIPVIISQILDHTANGAANGAACRVKLGAVHPTRDFNFVGDTVAGFIAAAGAEEAVGRVINIGSNFEISVGDTARMIADIAGVEIEIETDDVRLRPDASEVERLWCDNARAKAALSWQPAYDGRDGLRRGLIETLDWFADPGHRAAYKPQIYQV